jgi:tetratricopeptide (TPR) repeat protein
MWTRQAKWYNWIVPATLGVLILAFLLCQWETLGGRLWLNLSHVYLAKAAESKTLGALLFTELESSSIETSDRQRQAIARAGTFLSKAVAVDPPGVSVQRARAWLYLLQGQRDQFRDCLEAVTNEYPLDPISRGVLSWYYLSIGDLDEIEMYESPDLTPEALIQLANALKNEANAARESGHETRAQQLEMRMSEIGEFAINLILLRKRQLDAKDYYHLGLLHWKYLSEQDLDKVLYFFLKAYELAPGEPQYLAHAGYVSYSKMDYSTAESYFRQVVTRFPTFPQRCYAHNFLGLIAFNRGDYHEAVKELEAAVGECKDYLFYSRLARAYRATGNLEAAREAERESERLNPNVKNNRGGP